MDPESRFTAWLVAAALLSLAVVVAVLASLGWARRRRYRSVFRLSPRRDDRHQFEAPHETVAVRLDAGGFALPAGVALQGRTALLRLRVRSALRGRWTEPFIEVGSGDARRRQYFERGAEGQRYLNLSPLFAKGAASPVDGAPLRIQMTGRGIGWAPDAALELFDPPSLEGKTVLVVAPHPDDAEIAAFGLYADAAPRAWIVTVTAGECGPADFSAVVPDRSEAIAWNARLRIWDSVCISQLGGVAPERRLTLAYPDGALARMHAAPTESHGLACGDRPSRSALRASNARPDLRQATERVDWRTLVAELRRLLIDIQPDFVASTHPLLDPHKDHVFTTVALEEAARGLEKSPIFLLYGVHVRDASLHPLGPATGLVSLPPGADDRPIADGVYSHPLSTERRLGKYFAVEMNHDDITYESGEPRRARQLLAIVKRELAAWLAGLGPRPTSFLRRAPRPNEIFYLASPTTLAQLVERAQAARRPDARSQ